MTKMKIQADSPVTSVSIGNVTLSETKSTVYGSTGSAVYDPAADTLTLDNFSCKITGTKPCIAFSGDLTIVLKGSSNLTSDVSGILLSGIGSLTITGKGDNPSLKINSGEIGICTYSNNVSGSLTIDGVNLEITSVGDGIDSGKAVCITDSSIAIDAEHDGIEVETGGLTATDSAITIVSKEDGLDIDSTDAAKYTVSISGGSTVDITCTAGQFSGYGIDYDANTLTVTDSTVTIDASEGAFSPESSEPVIGPGLMYVNNGTSAAVTRIGDGNTPIRGDINGDKRVTVEDGVLLKQYFAGHSGEWLAGISEETADVNGDGNISRRDAMILERALACWSGYSLPYTEMQSD